MVKVLVFLGIIFLLLYYLIKFLRELKNRFLEWLNDVLDKLKIVGALWIILLCMLLLKGIATGFFGILMSWVVLIFEVILFGYVIWLTVKLLKKLF